MQEEIVFAAAFYLPTLEVLPLRAVCWLSVAPFRYGVAGAGASYCEMQKYDLIAKTALVSTVVIATNVFGNYALKIGLSNGGTGATWAPMPYIRALFHPWVIAGVVLLSGWFASRLVLLSWADLSYVLPVTAFSYVLSAVVGAVWLHEAVSLLHWGGICLITLGVAFTAFTFPETTPARSDLE